MKKDKETCKKSHESTIGKIIYGFLLFLPLLAIGVTCSYATFNKNAYKSMNKKETISNIQLSGQYVTNNDAIIMYTPSTNMGDQYNGYNKVQIDGTYIAVMDEQIYTILNMPREFTLQNIQIGMGSNGQQINLNYNNGWHNTPNVWGTTIKNLQFQMVNGITINTPNPATNTNVWAFLTRYTETTTLQNVFYDSIDKVENSNLFNWAENSVIYTGMSNFTTALSISNTFIPLLLTYWLIISIVYFLYDIVLVMLNVLHRKVHELQDSI